MKPYYESENVIIYHGDFAEVLSSIEVKTHLILTDPPYGAEYNYVWKKLGELSKEKLQDGGSLVSLCGHYHLPFVLNTLSEDLKYWWIGGIKHRKSNRFVGKWVVIKWKPCVWFVKDSRRITGNYKCPMDMYEDPPLEWRKSKAKHKWGQPIGFFKNWIDYLTEPGEFVIDPFMGSGTVGGACLESGRKFIGIDNDEKSCEVTVQRFKEMQQQIF